MTREELEKGIDSLFKELFDHRLKGWDMSRAHELLQKAEARLKESKMGEAEVYYIKARNVTSDLVAQHAN